MKSEDENPDEDAFERKIAGFRRGAAPEEWRDELIANAVPASRPVQIEKTRRIAFRFSLPEKILGGGLAAAWLVIIGLWITTPADQRTAEAGPSKPPMASSPLQSDQFPMLAWRFAGDETVEELLR